MEFSKRFDEINRLLYDIKHKNYVVEGIIEEKLQYLQTKEIAADDDEVWEAFLTRFYNDISHFKELNYYAGQHFPDPEVPVMDVDVATVNFKFLVTKYQWLLGLMREFADATDNLGEELTDHHPFQEWKEMALEKVEEFGENEDYFLEHK